MHCAQSNVRVRGMDFGIFVSRGVDFGITLYIIYEEASRTGHSFISLHSLNISRGNNTCSHYGEYRQLA